MDPDSPTPLNPVDSDCPSPPASDDPDATDTSDMQSNRQSNGSTSLPSSQRSSTTHAEPSSSAVQAPHDECIAESSQAPTHTRHGAITAMRRLNRMYRREATAIERIDHLLQLADECESAGLTTKAIRRYETIIRIVDFIAMVNKEDDPDFWLEIDDFTLVYDPFNEFEEKLKQQDEFDDL